MPASQQLWFSGWIWYCCEWEMNSLVWDRANLGRGQRQHDSSSFPSPAADSDSWRLPLAISVLGILRGGCWSEWALWWPLQKASDQPTLHNSAQMWSNWCILNLLLIRLSLHKSVPLTPLQPADDFLCLIKAVGSLKVGVWKMPGSWKCICCATLSL